MRHRSRSPLPWLGALLALYLVAPLVAFAIRLRHGAPSAPGLGPALVTSLLTATISTALVALLGVPLAYTLARARRRFADAVLVLLALPLALPPLVSGILLLYLVGPYTALGRVSGARLTDTRVGIVIAQTFVAAPFLLIAARAAFAGVDAELEDVARALGLGPLARFLRVALPAAWPGILAGLLLAWLRSFGEFGATVILAYHPYSLPVFTFVQFDTAGVGATMLPIAAALAAAVLFLAATQLHPRPRRRRPDLPAAAPPPARETQPVGFSLRKRLKGFELSIPEVPPGSRIALLGPSGAGKTLTLRLLAGLNQPDHATITAPHPEPAAQAARLSERHSIGYLPQASALLPRRTVWQQVNLAPAADPARARWWLEQLGLGGLEDRLPDELSGGQQRRVALARALAADPRLILLDEPFSALDAPVRRRLNRQLRNLQRESGLTTVLVTHDPEEAALLADHLVVLEAGHVLQQGPTEEVLARPRSPAVAALLGIENTHTATVAGREHILSGGARIRKDTAPLEPGQTITWRIAPEAIVLGSGGPYEGRLLDCAALPTHHELTVAVDGLELTVRTSQTPQATPGAALRIDLPAEAITLWPSQAPSLP